MNEVIHWLRQAEAWLDARGKGAWIAAMVLGFIFVWPVGLAFLIYMIGSKRMSCSRGHHRHHRFGRRSATGNVAFDAYRDETLRRLEDEQGAFQSFLEVLRKAKDKAEFDQFMNDQSRKPNDTVEVPA